MPTSRPDTISFTSQRLAAVTDTILSAALAQQTHQVYNRSWSLAENFAKHINRQTFPLDQSTIALFIAHLLSENYASSSIRTMIAALSFVHKFNGVPDPTDSFYIRKMLHGVSKLKPAADSRLPITKEMLHALVGAVSTIVNSPYEQLLFKLMFLVAFYALCRVGELTGKPHLHTLRAQDLRRYSDKLVVTFPTFKHSTRKQAVSIFRQSVVDFCPLSLMQQYLQVRPASAQYLFVCRKGQAVTRDSFNVVLRKCVALCGFDKDRVKSHSFRIGGATYAARRGLSVLAIQRLGRWKSNAFQKYIRW